MMIQPLLHQRLDIYRFAYVMVDPAQMPCQRDWMLPRLSASVANDDALAARLQLPTPIVGERGPVLSSSIRRLHYWRSREGMRPLILVRPAFETTVAPHRLAGLAKVPPLLGRLMFEHDAYTPLEWRRPLGSFDDTIASTDNDKTHMHPLLQRYRFLNKTHPSSAFTFQEDGSIVEQTSLLERSLSRQGNAWDASALQDYDRKWLARFGKFRGHLYVMSRSRSALSWFARDSLRLLGPYAYRWFYPLEPDLRNTGLNWIMVHDRDLRWSCLTRSIPIIHLEKDSQALAYRQLRLMQGGRVRWRSATPVVAKGLLRLGKQYVLCQDIGRGWQLALAEQAARDRSPILNRKFEALTVLSA